MLKIRTGRAIIHFPYKSKSTKRTYNSIILGLQRINKEYFLPGGQFDSKKDKSTLDTVVREVDEEFGLKALKSTARKAFTFHGNVCVHDIYVLEAKGTLKLDTDELLGVGFFNAGRHNQIPKEYLSRHVQALTSYYSFPALWNKRRTSIKIPGYYFVGNKDFRMIDWMTQRSLFINRRL